MATYENLDYGSPDGSIWGKSASEKVGFYGKVPVAQRAYTSGVHLSSEIASSTTFSTAHLAVVNEIQLTLIALGVWATA
jgi:hypothetical protein